MALPDLTGMTVFITGASRGIGAAAGEAFAQAGAKVALAARSSGEIEALASRLRKQGHQALALACDVTDYSAVQAAVGQAEAALGAIDILVNNAGLIEPIGRFADIAPADWARVIEVNVMGVSNTTHAVLTGMLERGQGTIINISSGAATGTLEGWTHYCASKAAVLSLTRNLDAEYRDQGIRVMGLSPGTVATHMQVVIKASGINSVSKLDPSVHKPTAWVGRELVWLAGPAGDAYLGQDFAIRGEAALREAGILD